MYRSRVIQTADDRYARYRIPGMLVTRDGTLLVYHDARREASDWASMDILLRRSTDQGRTFDEGCRLACGTKETPTVNNPVMVQDKTGRIHFLYCEDYGVGCGRIMRRFSDDDGCSFSEPIDITAATLPEYRNCFAFGPGHGIVTTDGTLILPIWMVPKAAGMPEREHAPSVVSTFFSTDDGENWQVGEILATAAAMVDPSESSAALLSDGRVYLTSASATGRPAAGRRSAPPGMRIGRTSGRCRS